MDVGYANEPYRKQKYIWKYICIQGKNGFLAEMPKTGLNEFKIPDIFGK